MKYKITSLIISSLICFNSYAGQAEQEIGVLNKIGYGVTDYSLHFVKKDGLDKWISMQLNKPNLWDDSEIEKRYSFPKTRDELFKAYKEHDFVLTGNKFDFDYFLGDSGIVTQSLIRRVDYALNSENRLREMMVWFWFNHFNIGPNTNHISGQFTFDFENKIRANALGNFKDMLKMVSNHPAMLYYLNNTENRNVKGDPTYGLNENYAREFLELHTLGVNGGYTQDDVRELARILTGFSIIHFENYKNQVKDFSKIQTYDDMKKLIEKEYAWSTSDYKLEDFFLFKGQYHDYGNKNFLGQTIKGEGIGELDRVIDMVSNHPKTAEFLSKKMAVYFLNDNPPKELIEKMASRYLESKGDIAKTLEPLMLSEEFKRTLEKPEKIKDTYSFMLSTIKTSLINNPGKNKKLREELVLLLKNIEADPYFKSTPEGFSIYGKDWLSSARMQEQIHFTISLLSQYETSKEYPINYKLLSLVAQKPIKNKQEALKFLTSEAWLKR